ncbi:MAG: protein kinase domain-containing protein [Candidatus Xenobia bacterium]
MKRLSLLAWLLVLVVGPQVQARPGGTEPHYIAMLLHSYPYRAEVDDTGGNPIGRTDEMFSYDVSSLLKSGAKTLTVYLKYPGYESYELTIPLDQAETTSSYQHDQIALRPKSTWVGVWTWVRFNPGLDVILVLLLAGVTGVFLQRRRELQKQLQRGAVLEGLRAARAETTNPLILAKIGGYRLIDLLGKGGMAMVYRAVPDGDLDQSKAVAVKVLDADASSDAAFRARFKKEVNASKGLIHPSIVKLIDWGEENGLLYLVMEVVEGDLLRRQIRPEMPYSRIHQLLEGLIGGLAYAHERGVIHRDLKPENIMVTKDDRVKIMDFGLARQEAATLTVDSKVLGTPSYMAPEQIEGEKTDCRTDEYSLGIIIYELICSARPFEGDYVETIIHKHLSEPPPPMTNYRPDVPEALQAAVFRMMAKKPEDRYDTVSDAWAAVREALDP